jgi:transposase-like protein
MGSHDRPNEDKEDNGGNVAKGSPSKRLPPPLARYTVADVARRYERKPSTVYRWIKAGRLGGTRLGGSGPITFTDADLSRFEHGQPPKRGAPPISAVVEAKTSGVDWIVSYRERAAGLHGLAPPVGE